MIHLFRWAGIALGIWVVRQAFLPSLGRKFRRYSRPADGTITKVTY